MRKIKTYAINVFYSAGKFVLSCWHDMFCVPCWQIQNKTIQQISVIIGLKVVKNPFQCSKMRHFFSKTARWVLLIEHDIYLENFHIGLASELFLLLDAHFLNSRSTLLFESINPSGSSPDFTLSSFLLIYWLLFWITRMHL